MRAPLFIAPSPVDVRSFIGRRPYTIGTDQPPANAAGKPNWNRKWVRPDPMENCSGSPNGVRTRVSTLRG